jgi:hypothetical protein
VNLDELRRELRHATELEVQLTEVFFLANAQPGHPSSGPAKRHVKFVLPFQKEKVKAPQAAIELRENGHIASKRKRELEAVIKNWNEDLQQKCAEAFEDALSWQRHSQKGARSSSPRESTSAEVRETHLSSARTQKGRKRESNHYDDDKAAVIFTAIKLNKKGPDYCKYLNDHRIRTSLNTSWGREGYPRTYPEAYHHKKWRRRINQEKSRFKAKMEHLDPREFERIMGLPVKVSAVSPRD